MLRKFNGRGSKLGYFLGIINSVVHTHIDLRCRRHPLTSGHVVPRVLFLGILLRLASLISFPVCLAGENSERERDGVYV